MLLRRATAPSVEVEAASSSSASGESSTASGVDTPHSSSHLAANGRRRSRTRSIALAKGVANAVLCWMLSERAQLPNATAIKARATAFNWCNYACTITRACFVEARERIGAVVL